MVTDFEDQINFRVFIASQKFNNYENSGYLTIFENIITDFLELNKVLSRYNFKAAYINYKKQNFCIFVVIMRTKLNILIFAADKIEFLSKKTAFILNKTVSNFLNVNQLNQKIFIQHKCFYYNGIC